MSSSEAESIIDDSTKEFTLEEIAKHNTRDDCWLILNDKVYAIPVDEIRAHPGGAEILLEFAGVDGTQEFDDIGHSMNTRTRIKQYKIGVVAGSVAARKNVSVLEKVKGKVIGLFGNSYNATAALAVGFAATVVGIVFTQRRLATQ